LRTPGYTADASLYAPRTHYQTQRQTSTQPTQMPSELYPALDIGEETINVVGCPPGYLQIGQGENTTCWPPPQTEGWIPEESQAPPGGEPLETKTRGPRKKKTETKRPPRPPKSPFHRFTPKTGNPCHATFFPDDPQDTAIVFAGKYQPSGIPGQYACCGPNMVGPDRHAACLGCQRSGDFGDCEAGDFDCMAARNCSNGWPCGPSGDRCPPRT
jgi:hypothetical protein